MAQDDARLKLDFERQHGGQLRLGELADVGLAEIGIGNHLRLQPCDRLVDLLRAQLEARRIPIVETGAVLAHGIHPILFEVGQHLRNHAGRLRIVFEQAVPALLEYLHQKRSLILLC